MNNSIDRKKVLKELKEKNIIIPDDEIELIIEGIAQVNILKEKIADSLY